MQGRGGPGFGRHGGDWGARPDPPDGAAEAVALRAELLRVNRRLAAVLDDGDDDLETMDRARELAGIRSELSTRWEHLSELLRKLRARRDRLAR